MRLEGVCFVLWSGGAGGLEASQVALVVKNSPAKAGDIRDLGLIPESGRSPEGRNSNTLQY